MSYTSGFFDAVDLGGGNYDREYSAAVFAHYFSLLIKNGVFPDPSTGMQVKASSNPDMHVSVQPGSGWVNGYYITVSDSSPEQLTIPTANPSLSRIDSVIMGLNYVQREIQLYIKSGAVSASPSAVSLQRDNDLYEMELAQITIAAGMASISQANITDMRQNTSRCGIVKGTIDQIDTTDLFAQYDNAFQTWFKALQEQMSGDVATNLFNLIKKVDNKVDSNWSKTISNNTKNVLGLPIEATPDDAFLKLAIGAGKYGYRIKVQSTSGIPLSGMTVTGATLPNGNTAVTDERGEALVVSSKATVSLGLSSPYIDVDSISDIQVTSTGTITEKTVTATVKSGIITVDSTQVSRYSKLSKSMDAFGSGGGGGGGGAWHTTSTSYNGGGGGAAGNAVNKLNIPLNNTGGTLKFQIGAGGAAGTAVSGTGATQGGTGGATTLTIVEQNKTVLTASGGPGGAKGPSSTAALSNNGNGGSGTVVAEAAKINVFDDASIGKKAGGGGGPGTYSAGVPAVNGGSPYGGKGGDYNTGRTGSPATGYGGGGGGGGVRGKNESGTGNYEGGAGYKGVIIVRFKE